MCTFLGANSSGGPVVLGLVLYLWQEMRPDKAGGDHRAQIYESKGVNPLAVELPKCWRRIEIRFHV
jgi:hypothetical protein